MTTNISSPLIISFNFPYLYRYSDALDILESLIEKDETNQIPRKRKVAILKSQGKIIEAIKELTDYLKM